MVDFWAKVGVSSIQFVFYAIVAFTGVMIGMKLRVRKNKKG